MSTTDDPADDTLVPRPSDTPVACETPPADAADRAALLTHTKRVRAMTAGTLSDSTPLIREDRDSR